MSLGVVNMKQMTMFDAFKKGRTGLAVTSFVYE